MSLRFRGSYGQETLQYDIFGGGATEFTNLLLRAGQDQEQAIIRNELSQSLCEKADHGRYQPAQHLLRAVCKR